MLKNQSVTQVCDKEECDNDPTNITVGSVEHTFCCQKGFESSVAAFTAHMSRTAKPLKQ